MRLSPVDRRTLAMMRPRTRPPLRAWLRLVLGITVPHIPRIDGSAPPFEYLCHSFLPNDGPRDCVVWAARGAGKTFYAALATALDLLFRPGIEVMLLGGSLEQSGRMHAHLRRLLASPAVTHLLDGRPTERRIRLINGSCARIVAQSPTSIRGIRPTVLRCDEVELFDPELWDAAQLVTRAGTFDGEHVPGTIHALSTWHQPDGLMRTLVESCTEQSPVRRLFRWGMVDVLHRCPELRPCETCALLPECAGAAKLGEGHIDIDDAIRMKARVDCATWDAEMLCRRPARSHAVYPEFDEQVHVADFEIEQPQDPARGLWIGGIDFGFRSPTVILWAQLRPDGVLAIVDVHSAAEATIETHVQAIRARRWPVPTWFGVDPAGLQRSAPSGLSPVAALRRHGLAIRTRRAPLHDGLRAVRTRFAPASGPPGLLVHARCRELIDALRAYRFPPGERDPVQPIKDGADHACDALRYLVINLDAPVRTTIARYA